MGFFARHAKREATFIDDCALSIDVATVHEISEAN
jgi:hypothetical protein